MVVERILEQLTPEKIKKEWEKVNNIEFPQETQWWIKKYNREIKSRDPLVWSLIFRFIEIVDFSPVQQKHQHSLLQARFLLTMLVVLVDDVVDKHQNKRLRECLLNIPLKENQMRFKDLSVENRLYLDFGVSIWQAFLKLAKDYPRHEIFKKTLYFDVLQIFNSMRFSALINDNPRLINTAEYWGYSPNSMQLMAHYTLNLMCSNGLNLKEMGMIRKIVWHAQYMLRIGNCLGTWEREIKEGDYSNGIFAHLIEKGILETDSLVNGGLLIDKKDITEVEDYFFRQWEKHYIYIKKTSPKIKFFDTKKFLLQLEKILILHLSIRNI
jgi:hypothetical protein